MAAENVYHQPETEDLDFLTQEQRIDAIADILSTIALRVVTKDHEQKNANLN